MKKYRKIIALLLALCVAGLPVFAMATDGGDGVPVEVPADPPPAPPAPDPEPDPQPVQPPQQTEVPATAVPATEVPATEVPATEVPATEVPATEVPPTTEVPTTDAPVTDAPATVVPETEATTAPTTDEVSPEPTATEELDPDTAALYASLMAISGDAIPISEDLNYDEVSKTYKVTTSMSAEVIKTKLEEYDIQTFEIEQGGSITGGEISASVTVKNGGTISGGTYSGTVTNEGGTISGGTYSGIVNNEGLVQSGIFNESCTFTNKDGGTIQGNTIVHCNVDNAGTIDGGTFDAGKTVTNKATTGKIETGVFNGSVINEDGSQGIENGTFKGEVTNNGEIGNGTFSGKVINNKTIKNGTFGEVENNDKGTIEKGTFSGAVVNYGTIADGTFSGKVTNGEPQPTSTETPDPTPKPGKINGGTFEGELHNNSEIKGGKEEEKKVKIKSNATIYPNYGSTAENCTFETDVTIGDPKGKDEEYPGGKIFVTYWIDNDEKEALDYKEKAKSASVGLPLPKDGYEWKYYDKIGGNANSLSTVTDTTEIGIFTRTFVQGVKQQTQTTTPSTNTNKNNSTSSGSSSSGSSYTWTDPATSNWGDNEEDEEIVLGPEQQLAEDYLEDGGSVRLDILHNGSNAGADYELIPIPATSPEPDAAAANGTVDTSVDGELDLGDLSAEDEEEPEEEEEVEEPVDTDGDGIPNDGDEDIDGDGVLNDEDEDIDGDGILNDEDEDADGDGVPDEEEVARIPGEADEDGNVPTMLYVRAKGLGTEERKLALTFSQLQRMKTRQGVEVLLFRNGSATVSLSLTQLFEGNVAKLMELMHAWEYNGANFDDYDLSIIDFDAIQIAPVFTDEELREFKLELSIAPAVPVGYTVQANLCLGENSKEISLLLEDMGVTMHAQTVTDNVAVYYMNAEQERFLLETHEGVVPGVKTEIEGYEVLFDAGTATVLDLNRSVTDTEFAGLCAATGDTGTYYIGVLPSAQASATPAAGADAEATPEPTETPEPTATPEDLSMELVVDVPR